MSKEKDNILEFQTTEEKELNDKQSNILRDILRNVNEAAPDTGLEGMFTTLALPDDQFNIMSQLVINELEKALNDPGEKMTLVQGMHAAGTTVEDLNAMFAELIKQINLEIAPHFDSARVDFLKQVIAAIVTAINDTEGVAKKVIHVAIEKIHKDVKTPTYANSGDAGLDLYSLGDYEIKPGETLLIPTGIKVALPLGYEFQARPKSGMSLKTKLRVGNSPGTIDCNYRGEVGIIIENIEAPIKDIQTEPVFIDGKLDHLKLLSVEHGRSFFIEKGQKFAQLVLKDNPMAIFFEVDSVKELGQDRAGGFGSSGKF